MATWVTHLMVADEVIKKIPSLCKHEFSWGILYPIVMWKMKIGQDLLHQEK